MALSFTCPGCRAHLKVRDESAAGQTLDCPECQSPLLVVLSPMGEISGQLIAAEKTSLPTRTTTSSKTGKSAGPSTQKPVTAGKHPHLQTASSSVPPLRNPRVIAWSVAGVFLLLFISILILVDRPIKDRSDPSDQIPGTAEFIESQGPSPADPALDESPAPDSPTPDTPEGRLQALGKLVRTRAAKDGHFPSGTVGAADLPIPHRWSWQAQLAAERDNPAGTQIDWNQRWNDPATDRFVRRPIPRFQNPQVELQTSEDKYPAAHYVGVAGVGTDAAILPINHPRAGIFGQDRKTKITDIHDGLSNTMLLAGVEQHPGSWAEGAASYRAFTREPYLHGPDGFGTGQPKSMFVLMADGSVKEISSSTDPRIVRRMAAMNDGLPLDSKVPGEPGDTLPSAANPVDPPTKTEPDTKVPAKVADVPKTTKQPMPENAPVNPGTPVKPTIPIQPEVIVDIPSALSRRILSFDQTKPAAAFQLLLQIEELSGVRIDYDRKSLGPAAERLDKPISLRMKNATLEELLADILRQIDLQRKDEKSRIIIVAPS